MLQAGIKKVDQRKLEVRPGLRQLASELKRAPKAFEELAAQCETLLTKGELANTVRSFELIVNRCLDAGYRDEGLLAFVFTVMNRRFAARIGRRLKTSRLGARPSDVEDLVMVTIEGVHRLFHRSERREHTVTYALLLSIADHRAIDFLRRKRADLVACVDGHIERKPSHLFENRRPDREYERNADRRRLRAVREVILTAVNQLERAEREALIMVEVDGVGYGEVAKQLKMKPTDVGNFVRRARKKRDRNLIAELRMIPALDGHVGFGELQSNKELRTNLLRWAAEIGDGFCLRCMRESLKLHTADKPCFTQVVPARVASRKRAVQAQQFVSVSAAH